MPAHGVQLAQDFGECRVEIVAYFQLCLSSDMSQSVGLYLILSVNHFVMNRPRLGKSSYFESIRLAQRYKDNLTSFFDPDAKINFREDFHIWLSLLMFHASMDTYIVLCNKMKLI